MIRKAVFSIALVVGICTCTFAQDSSSVFFTTGVGLIKVSRPLSKVLKPALSFNSGLEIANKKNWFLQGTVDFNTLAYYQQITENASPYLFQNANSSLLLLGLNGGKNFDLSRHLFISGYIGGGYINIGEPRATLKNNIVTQDIARQSSGFGRIGSRAGYKTGIGFLQTIYFDAAWLASTITVQDAKLNGFSFFVGLRMHM